MNTHHWIRRFESNRDTYDEPDWSGPCSLGDPAARSALAASLATFQLGESGGGTRLLRFARRLAQPERFPDYEKAVHLFIAEEQYHAELLERLVDYLDGELIEKHWTNSVFRGVRSLINLEFNIQVLLTAELIAEAYYGLLHRHASDPIVESVCGKILRDEVGHIAFHLDFFGSRFRDLSPPRRLLWTTQFRTLFLATASVVWLDHRPCFGSLGVSRAAYHASARRACESFLERLERKLLAPTVKDAAPAR